MSEATPLQNCDALTRGDWHSYGCARKAKTERLGHPLCTQHAKRFDEWDADNSRDVLSMVEFWWKWRLRDE